MFVEIFEAEVPATDQFIIITTFIGRHLGLSMSLLVVNFKNTYLTNFI